MGDFPAIFNKGEGKCDLSQDDCTDWISVSDFLYRIFFLLLAEATRDDADIAGVFIWNLYSGSYGCDFILGCPVHDIRESIPESVGRYGSISFPVAFYKLKSRRADIGKVQCIFLCVQGYEEDSGLELAVGAGTFPDIGNPSADECSVYYKEKRLAL